MTQRKNQLITIISLLLIAGFMVTSLASFFVSRSSLRSHIIQNELPLTSDNIYSEIQHDLLRPIFISSLMATDTFLRDWVLQGEQCADKITHYLKEIQIKYNTFTAFFVSEQTKIYYHSDGILKKIKPDEARDKWYFRVQKMTSDYEINVDPDMANKDAMTIFINHRVYDYKGNYIGATGIGLTVHAVKLLIENYQQRYHRNIYFIDKEGNIPLHGQNFTTDIKNIFEIDGIRSLRTKILFNQDTSFKYKNNGTTVHLNTRYIPEFGWYLFVEQSEEESIRQILHTLFINLAICIVITIIVVMLTNLTLSAYQSRLEKMATTDKLTGIYNRRAFDIIINQALKDVHRNKTGLSVILFDIDLFKKINDTLGHIAGDSVIQHVVNITCSNMRASDVICRWGGEEFLILLKGCNLDNAFNMAEKIRKAVSNAPALYKGTEIPVTISLGVAQYIPEDNEDSMLIRVDKALYTAKQSGRNRTEKAPLPM
ncbi:MAG: sensor domain-containing diguanylate cyclase [Desulfobacterales bacterium]|nr:sensor domain-containing diguanylate cyclase [Desulfobacterales bacterium]MDD4072645.1 sensor domain-containing diguanylate cyclase [Desulfobacterales bacterium]MDD4391598.1 sensor domain-containing diguanylate cyclase [Desulfobacterales bacterium]